MAMLEYLAYKNTTTFINAKTTWCTPRFLEANI